MKFTLILGRDDEEVVVYAKEKSEAVKMIESIALGTKQSITAFTDNDIVNLNINEVFCFLIEDGKTYAMLEKEKLKVKSRIYELEASLPKSFIKINKSVIANLEKVERFRVTFGASLSVIFKNGYTDYVSRRQLKYVKERMSDK